MACAGADCQALELGVSTITAYASPGTFATASRSLPRPSGPKDIKRRPRFGRATAAQGLGICGCAGPQKLFYAACFRLKCSMARNQAAWARTGRTEHKHASSSRMRTGSPACDNPCHAGPMRTKGTLFRHLVKVFCQRLQSNSRKLGSCRTSYRGHHIQALNPAVSAWGAL